MNKAKPDNFAAGLRVLCPKLQNGVDRRIQDLDYGVETCGQFSIFLTNKSRQLDLEIIDITAIEPVDQNLKA